ncbi:MAG: ribonuclease J, partial [Firmicutes bacterium]|nr:ribonuclease J [Bacillota bacterium]
MAQKESKITLIPLGGLGEIGNNMTAVRYGNSMIIVDCGMEFPDDDMLGIDTVIPDYTFLL